jgi:hypothetical protein
MVKMELQDQDDLRPEYNLHKLKVRKLGAGRNDDNVQTVELENDVAKLFPDSQAVNEALRFLIRITRENKIVDRESTVSS